VEQIVVKGRLETRRIEFADSSAGYVLIDETTGETLYALSDPRDLLTQRIGDLAQVHGTLAETEGDIPLLEVTRLD
jgi:hypothetical protein